MNAIGDPSTWIAVATALTAVLVAGAVVVGRARGVLLAFGLTALLVLGVVVGEWLVTLWATALLLLVGDGWPLDALWATRQWLVPAALLATAVASRPRATTRSAPRGSARSL